MLLRFFLCPLIVSSFAAARADDDRPRLIIETDAGGDPDDEQSLVRLLVYANEFELEGLIANRAKARDGENRHPVRDGLGIVKSMVKAYGECHANLVKHDPRFPTTDQLLARTVPGYHDSEDGVNLLIRAVDSPDPRPVWFSNWGTDHGSDASSLRRALDRILRERGPDGYAKFKNRLRLCSDDQFGDHTGQIDPPFPIWIFASRPELDGKRWYHRFSALTATAGGFDLERDVRTGHGPLGAMYPTNTTHRQKEGDSMYFLYLLPTGMNDPMQPSWGSWGGRHGPHDQYPGKPYWWANVKDTWKGSNHRDHTLARWAAALQNDFAARMDWCVADAYEKANHRPIAAWNGDDTGKILKATVRAGESLVLHSGGTRDPDGNATTSEWFIYPEAGTFRGDVSLKKISPLEMVLAGPPVERDETIHVIHAVQDDGKPPLTSYRRMVVTVKPGPPK